DYTILTITPWSPLPQGRGERFFRKRDQGPSSTPPCRGSTCPDFTGASDNMPINWSLTNSTIYDTIIIT
ncbi:MAG: hypothetical protein NTZ34_01555, partial [Chloroflexi bacterium]|nr:hypothetical protein [Chloroflexota bacterium]